MKPKNSLFASVPIFGGFLSLSLDVIEPFFGGFRIAIFLFGGLLIFGILVYAIPPINAYIRSENRPGEFREIVDKYWPKPFFISNVALLILLISMFQLNQKFEETGGFTKSALSSLNLIESDVQEIKEISKEHLEVAKAGLEQSVFQSDNYASTSVLMYVQNGYPFEGMDGRFTNHSALIEKGLGAILVNVFNNYDTDEQLKFLAWLDEAGYLANTKSVAISMGQQIELPDDPMPLKEFKGRLDNLKVRLVAIDQLKHKSDASRKSRDTTLMYRKRMGVPEENDDMFYRDYLDEIEELKQIDQFLKQEGMYSDVTAAADVFEARLRVASIRSSYVRKLTTDPATLALMENAKDSASWLKNNVDLDYNGLVTVTYPQGFEGIYAFPSWDLQNRDELFWNSVFNGDPGDISEMTKAESRLLELNHQDINLKTPWLPF